MNAELIVQLFHILIVGGLFLYVGIRKTEIPKIMFPALIALGVIIVLYHGYKAIYRIQHKKSYLINLFHIILVGPLLAYIGYFGVETQRMYFEFLLMLCFSVVGYHGYYMMLEI